jgi:hypothetical protein
MAHNNKTPASILTAPKRVLKAIVAHVPVKRTEKNAVTGKVEEKLTGALKHQGKGVDPLTGVYRNPERAHRKARAAEKRARRNKGGNGKRGTGR